MGPVMKGVLYGELSVLLTLGIVKASILCLDSAVFDLVSPPPVPIMNVGDKISSVSSLKPRSGLPTPTRFSYLKQGYKDNWDLDDKNTDSDGDQHTDLDVEYELVGSEIPISSFNIKTIKE